MSAKYTLQEENFPCNLIFANGQFANFKLPLIIIFLRNLPTENQNLVIDNIGDLYLICEFYQSEPGC